MEVVIINEGINAKSIDESLPFKIRVRYKATAIFEVRMFNLGETIYQIKTPVEYSEIDNEGYTIFTSQEISRYFLKHPNEQIYVSFKSEHDWGFDVSYEIIKI